MCMSIFILKSRFHVWEKMTIFVSPSLHFMQMMWFDSFLWQTTTPLCYIVYLMTSCCWCSRTHVCNLQDRKFILLDFLCALIQCFLDSLPFFPLGTRMSAPCHCTLIRREKFSEETLNVNFEQSWNSWDFEDLKMYCIHFSLWDYWEQEQSVMILWLVYCCYFKTESCLYMPG